MRAQVLTWIRQPVKLAGVAILLLSLALYLATLDNGLTPGQLQGGDLITHQYAQAALRLSNAPGYPLYTMLGWVWFRLGRLILSPFFNPVEILSLFSTLWGLGALVAMYVLALELTEKNWPISALATLLYAVTYFFWYYSVTSEEYTTAVLQTLLMILVVFRWERTREDKYLLILALMVGLALANLVTVLLALPALLVYILSLERTIWRRLNLLGRAVLLTLLPLVSYLYVFVRGAQHPEWRGAGQWPDTWSWFLYFLSIPQGRDELTWSFDGVPWAVLRLINSELTPVVLLAGLAGLAFMPRRRGLLFGGIILTYAPVLYIDRYGNWFQVAMPLYPLVILGLAVLGYHLWQRYPRLEVRGVLLLLLLALTVNRVGVNFPRCDQRDRVEDKGLVAGWQILADAPTPGATVAGSYEENLALDYLTAVWGERTDLAVVAPDQLPAKLAEGDIYLTRTVAASALAQWPTPPPLSSHGLSLIEIKREAGGSSPRPRHLLNLDVGGRLHLVGYEAREELGALHLTLYWQALARMEEDWSISVRPTREGQFLFNGGVMIQQDHAHPVWGHYPTSRWASGEVVRDDYLIPLPGSEPYDGVKVIVYRPVGDSFQNLGQVSISPLVKEQD